MFKIGAWMICFFVVAVVLRPNVGSTRNVVQQNAASGQQQAPSGQQQATIGGPPEECIDPLASGPSTSLDPDTYQVLTAIDSRFNCELRNEQRALNALPQRLLSDAAQDAIRAPLEQLKGQIEQLRQKQDDLQHQIDDLKHNGQRVKNR